MTKLAALLVTVVRLALVWLVRSFVGVVVDVVAVGVVTEGGVIGVVVAVVDVRLFGTVDVDGVGVMDDGATVGGNNDEMGNKEALVFVVVSIGVVVGIVGTVAVAVSVTNSVFVSVSVIVSVFVMIPTSV